MLESGFVLTDYLCMRCDHWHKAASVLGRAHACFMLPLKGQIYAEEEREHDDARGPGGGAGADRHAR